MESTVISIPNGESNSSSPNSKKNTKQFSFNSIFSLLQKKCNQPAVINVIHSFKVGIALVLVSLLYLLDPLFKQVGENAMWAIMTVVVVFEFYAGATLSKGINRGIGTILGGGLGCLAAILADQAGENIGNAVVVGTSVFIVGAAATYTRLIPTIKQGYDYGVMIFILTFNLVAVSGLRADTVMKLAKERLSTIGMGFVVCIFTNLLIFPMWASDELHSSTASKFDKLASCIEECLEEYLRIQNNEENPSVTFSQACNSVLHSKSKDETLAKFAKWEPWHGKFGFFHPWDKYLEIGEVLRELAAVIISLKMCIQSSRQPALTQRRIIKEPCEMIGLSLTWILRELGENIMKMETCQSKVLIVPKCQSINEQLSLLNTLMQTAEGLEPDEHFATVSFSFLLTEIAEKAQVLSEKVENFGEVASFQLKKPSVIYNF